MKRRFKKQFAKKVFTRLHMSLILLATILSGVIFSKVLLLAGLNHIVARFVLVLIFAYICFFILMKLWLHYLTEPYRERNSAEDLIDTVDAVASVPDFSSTRTTPNMTGHGGEFGGAGASGAWTDDGAESMADTATETVGEAVSGIADEGGIILIPLILFLIVLFGGGIYLIYEAPVIISEAAFELVLATALVKKARAIDNPNWMGSVFRATWVAFALTMAVTAIAGWVMMAYCPPSNKNYRCFSTLHIDYFGPTIESSDAKGRVADQSARSI